MLCYCTFSKNGTEYVFVEVIGIIRLLEIEKVVVVFCVVFLCVCGVFMCVCVLYFLIVSPTLCIARTDFSGEFKKYNMLLTYWL